MPKWRDISIKRKLTLIIMAASTVALLLAGTGFVAYELFTFREKMTRDLETLADIIGNRSTAALSFEDKKDAKETLDALRAKPRIVAACLYDKNGKVFVYYLRDPEPFAFPRPEKDAVRFEKDSLVLFREIVKDDFLGTIYLKSDLHERRDRFERYAGMIGILLLASLAVTFILSGLLQRIITRPIYHLARTAKIVSQEKNYKVRAQKEAHDELGQLMDGFNEMLDQIEQRNVALRCANDDLEKCVQERTENLRLEIIERKRAQEGLQQQLARISLLNQITQAISERQDLESILHVVLRQLEDHIMVDFGCVNLFDAQAEALNMAALRVKNPLLTAKMDLHVGSVLSLNEAALTPCRQGETIYFPDTLKISSSLAERLAHGGIRSAVVVPLMVDRELFGVLVVARFKVNDFSSSESEFLRTLSEHVALAAHQARLHTDLEKAYNELRQTQQAVMQQERLKALGQMASGIAHDVNNALSPVVGFADLLLRGEKGLTATGKKNLQHIKTAGEDIAHIVSRLREFYRKRDERESLNTLDLNKLAEQVIDMTRPRWRDIPQGRGIMVEVKSDFEAELPEFLGMESEVREALTNLILNAVDALPNGGIITLRTRFGGMDFTSDGKAVPTHAILEVIDTGMGMDEKTRAHCLEPFFSTKGKRGTGLGLAMVYGVIERHEGKIEIESELGKGTTIRLIFPIRMAAQTDLYEQDKTPPARPLQVLCIDDEPLLRELLQEILEREGHTVEARDSGEAGIEAFRAARQRGTPFDIVITDLGMPYLDGRQVAKTLKREAPATPIIMLTGWGAFMKEDGETPPQVDGILSKPPRSRELREAMHRLTAKSPVMCIAEEKFSL